MFEGMTVCARAVVRGADVGDAAGRLAGELGAPALLLVFASYQVPIRELAHALAGRFPSTQVVGCTSSGEIGGEPGVSEGSIAALAFYAPAVKAGVGIARELRGQSLTASRDAVTTAAAALGRAPRELDPRRHVAITLFDGRSSLAEGFCLATAATAPQIQFVGGACSDLIGGAPRTRTFVGEQVIESGGVVAILETDTPFHVIAWEHLAPTPVKVVVTAADPDQRLLTELDGQPALDRYRELVAGQGGTITDTESAAVFPFARYVEGKAYVRSVYEIEGRALRMASAVETGQILRLMRTGDLVGSTARELERADSLVHGMCALVAFSCVARHFESTRSGLVDGLAALYRRFPVVGFHTFGEQLGATLVNHTLTGLALGTRAGSDHPVSASARTPDPYGDGSPGGGTRHG
jgi:hypothetical protein